MEFYIRNTATEKHSGAVDMNGKDWPPHGKIEFDNVEMRYFPDSPLVLNKVTFTVQPGEKIGIVGRTGSGKSTLLMALFRLVELDAGQIIIDGQDIGQMTLDSLRSNLAIIPQEPVLFKGTIRSNLDPFNQHKDEELWRALEACHLKADVEKMPLRLDSVIVKNGENMSLGQKQLFCLGRVALKKTPILVLDEATSALDLETDNLIQKTLRQNFNHCTIMTIAHRLETIMDYDKILFLDAGRVLEFESRQTLLANPESAFYKLVHA
eukprot:Colp12_sorted_trinity150504_noHs@23771